MGVKGLLVTLKSITNKRHLSFYRNKKVAIDGYTWLHRAKYAMGDAVLHKPIDITNCINYFQRRLFSLLKYNIKPVFVFDGASLPMKKKEEERRRENRKELKKEASLLLSKGDKSAAVIKLLESFDITPEFTYEFLQTLRKFHVEFYIAPYEADAQLAFLSKINYVDFVITEDSDLLAYGCKCVLFKLHQTEEDFGDEIKFENLPQCKEYNFRAFDYDMFLSFCILCGCDYFKLGGVGSKTAYKIIGEGRNYRESLRSLISGNKGAAVGEMHNINVLSEEFEKAFLTFKLQVVYDPVEKKMTRFCSSDDIKIGFYGKYKESLDFCGRIEENVDVVENLIFGAVNPNTLEPLGVEGQFCHTMMSEEVCFPSVDTSRRGKDEMEKIEDCEKEKITDENAFINRLLTLQEKQSSSEEENAKDSSSLNEFLEIEFKNPENQNEPNIKKAKKKPPKASIKSVESTEKYKDMNQNSLQQKPTSLIFSHFKQNVESSSEGSSLRDNGKFTDFNVRPRVKPLKMAGFGAKRKSALILNNGKFGGKFKKKVKAKEKNTGKNMRNQGILDDFLGRNERKAEDFEGGNDENRVNFEEFNMQNVQNKQKFSEDDLLNYNFYSQNEGRISANSRERSEIRAVAVSFNEEGTEGTPKKNTLKEHEETGGDMSKFAADFNIDDFNYEKEDNEISKEKAENLLTKSYIFPQNKKKSEENLKGKRTNLQEKSAYLNFLKSNSSLEEKKWDESEVKFTKESHFLDDLLDKYKIENVEKELQNYESKRFSNDITKENNVKSTKENVTNATIPIKNACNLTTQNALEINDAKADQSRKNSSENSEENAEIKLLSVTKESSKSKNGRNSENFSTENDIKNKVETVVLSDGEEDNDENSSKMNLFLEKFKFDKKFV